MNLINWIKSKVTRPSRDRRYADMLSGYAPIFTQFGDDIYKSDVVQQAMSCIVLEMKKLRPMHVKVSGSDAVPVDSDISKVLRRPNELMTTSDFLEKIMWQLLFNYNSFVLPTYKRWTTSEGVMQQRITGLYPIAPTQVDFIEDAGGVMYIRFRFRNGYETEIPYSEVIHIRHHFSVNEFMGGNEMGQPDHEALLDTLNLNKQLLTNVDKALKSSFAVNGVVKIKSMLDDGKTQRALQELEEKLKNSESGFLPLDITSDFIPIQRSINIVDSDTLKFIDEKILRHFGVPLPILTGDYTKAQYGAFYQKTLEPFVISISQAFTKALFTDREESYKNQIKLYPKDLVFMSVDQTLEMVRLLGDSGSLYENEKRAAFGLPPLKELEGVRMQSLNYVDVNIAGKYQVGKNSEEGGDTDEQNEDGNSLL